MTIYRGLKDTIKTWHGWDSIKEAGEINLVWPILGVITVVLVLFFMAGNARAESLAVGVDMMKIVKIESSYNPRAFNKYSGARGYCQITPIVLKEFNALRKEQHSLEELFNGPFNIIVGAWYMNQRIPQLLKHYHVKDTIKNRLIAYNAGIRNVIKHRIPTETKNYIRKYNTQ